MEEEKYLQTLENSKINMTNIGSPNTSIATYINTQKKITESQRKKRKPKIAISTIKQDIL